MVYAVPSHRWSKFLAFLKFDNSNKVINKILTEWCQKISFSKISKNLTSNGLRLGLGFVCTRLEEPYFKHLEY